MQIIATCRHISKDIYTLIAYISYAILDFCVTAKYARWYTFNVNLTLFILYRHIFVLSLWAHTFPF